MSAEAVFEVDPQSFQTDVIERSKTIPVVVLFWTDQVPPAADTKRTLEVLIGQYQGKAALGLSDVAVDPSLAQHLRVQGVPSIRVIKDGQLVEQLDGPQEETSLRELLDALTMSSGDLLKDQLGDFIARGEYQTALQILQQALQEEPHNPAFRIELADVLILTGELDEARKALATVAEDAEDRERPVTRLEIMEEAAAMPSVADLAAAVEQSGDDLEARYQLAIQLAASREFEAALDHAMYILQTDRSFREDIGRMTMIRIFALLGKGSEMASQYRRRMFNYMH
jgi:putative thioredoxin